MPHTNPTRLRTRAAAAGLGLGLAIGSFALVSPASAQITDRDAPTRDLAPAPTDEATPVPTDVRDTRPVRDLEVLQLRCGVADTVRDSVTDIAPDRTRIHIGCRWRAAESKAAVGYQLWRIVDRGERELVVRGGLDMVGHRDVVSAKAHVVRYAVIAVNEHGRMVGLSRVERVVLDDDRLRPVPNDRRRNIY
ncbi:MAG: hypothetical protein GY929_21640 [Actinomycetia bacterium]|nr:hypothetical protein [Actinomycetes bacterium]MCP4226611.1 hypothetical protein [Actinomycetes bacterium]MCP5028885.1 hypothetical protein [Actinomycetes bacterium]